MTAKCVDALPITACAQDCTPPFVRPFATPLLAKSCSVF